MFKPGHLNPIATDQQPRMNSDANKSVDLSRVFENTRIRSETPKLSDLNKSIDTTKISDHYNNQSINF